MDKTVGIIGLGIMGGAIAATLMERGWTVIGYDVDQDRMAELAAAGMTRADSVEEVAKTSGYILTSLPSPAAAFDIADQIAASGQPQRIVIELSTLTIADK